LIEVEPLADLFARTQPDQIIQTGKGINVDQGMDQGGTILPDVKAARSS
jgi:hypothetical protein